MKSASSLPNTAEASTPELQSLRSDDDDVNEVWIPCSICKLPINPHCHCHHKQQHKAETQLGYKPSQIPRSIRNLSSKRREVISYIKDHCGYKQALIHNVDRSYDILKRIQITPIKDIRRISPQDFEKTLVYKTDKINALIPSIAVCCDKNPSWQRDMEDSFVILDKYGGRSDTCLVGIFDGCRGKSAACTMAREFPTLFLGQLLNLDPSYTITDKEKRFLDSLDTVFKDHYKDAEKHFSSALYEKASSEMDIKAIHIAYAKAFWRMDRILQLGRKESSRAIWSGCSSVSCLFDGFADAKSSQKEAQLLGSTQEHKRRLGVLHIASVGNVKAVLCRNGKPYCLTKSHSSCSERTHAKENSGSHSANEDQGLVESVTKVSGGLGYHGDLKLKNSVIPAPHTLSIPIYQTCQFLVLGSSGLWDVLSGREVVSIAMKVLKDSVKNSDNSKAKLDYLQPFQNVTAAENIHEVTVPNCIDSSGVPERRNGLNEDEGGANPGSHLELRNPLNLETRSESRRACKSNPREMYNNAAACVCQRLVMAAVLAGSQQNVTVCLVLLPGCLNINEPSEKM